MASIALFGATNDTSSITLTGSTTQTQANTTTQAQANTATQSTASEDTVKLSAEAQAKLLRKQGESVSVIASTLGTDTKTVDNYLNIAQEEELEKTLEETLTAKA
jgi:hypothetical protein